MRISGPCRAGPPWGPLTLYRHSETDQHVVAFVVRTTLPAHTTPRVRSASSCARALCWGELQARCNGVLERRADGDAYGHRAPGPRRRNATVGAGQWTERLVHRSTVQQGARTLYPARNARMALSDAPPWSFNARGLTSSCARTGAACIQGADHHARWLASHVRGVWLHWTRALFGVGPLTSTPCARAGR